jgi:hypothetical protein
MRFELTNLTWRGWSGPNEPAHYWRRWAEKITVAKNGGGADPDLMTTTGIAECRRTRTT